MRKIVLRHVPSDIRKVIRRKIKSDGLSTEDAVLELIRDADLQSAIEHDIAILESWEGDEEELPF